MARSTLAVRFTGDTSALQSSIGKVDKGLGGLGTKVGGFSRQVKTALGVGAAGAAVTFGKSAVAAFQDAEAAQAELDAAFTKFPQLAGENADALRELNEELARKTQFDDDASASGQAVLAQFGLTADQMKRLTPLMQDYAQRTGKDLPTAAEDLGKAVLGQGRALKGIGVNFKDTGNKAENFEQLIGGLDDKVGGLAETAGGTTSGKLKILGNQFGELQETVGQKLIPVLTTLLSVGLGVVNFLTGLSPEVQAVIGIVAGLAAGVFVIVKAVQAWTAVQAAFNVVMSANPIVLVGIAIAALVAGVIVAYKNVGWFRDAVDKVADVFQNTLWPILQAVVGWFTGTLIPTVGRIIAAVVDFGGKVAEVAGRVISSVADFVGKVKAKLDEWTAKVSAVVQTILGYLGGLLSWIGDIPGKIGRAMSGAWDGLKEGLADAVRWILGKIDTMLGPLDEVLGKLGSVKSFMLGGNSDLHQAVRASLDPDKKRARGGHVMAGDSVLVGEDGPELLRMGGNGHVTPNSALRAGTGGMTAVPVILELDGQVLGRAMIRFAADYRSTNGRAAFGG